MSDGTDTTESDNLARTLQRLSITMLESYKGSDAAKHRGSTRPARQSTLYRLANRQSVVGRPVPRLDKQPASQDGASQDGAAVSQEKLQQAQKGDVAAQPQPRQKRASVAIGSSVKLAAPPSRKKCSDPGPQGLQTRPHVRILPPLGQEEGATPLAAPPKSTGRLQPAQSRSQPSDLRVSFAEVAGQESSRKSSAVGQQGRGSTSAGGLRRGSSSVLLGGEGNAQVRAPSRNSVLPRPPTMSIRESVMAMLGAKEQLSSIIAEGTPTIVPPSDRQPIMELMELPPAQRGGARELAPVLRVLQKVPFLSELDGNALLEVCRWVRYQFLHGGTVVFNQGDLGALFYIIASGKVGISSIAQQQAGAGQASGEGSISSGQQQQQQRQTPGQEGPPIVLEAGQTFGEKALTKTGLGRRNATVTAITECELFTLDIHQYHSLVSRVMEEDLAAKVEVLRGFEVTAGWSEAQLREVASVLTLKKLPADKVVVHQGSPSTSLFFLKSGEVRVVRHMPSSKRVRHLLSNQVMLSQFQPDSQLRNRLKDTALKEGSASSGPMSARRTELEMHHHLLPLQGGNDWPEDVYVEIATLGPNELFGEVGAPDGKYRQASILTNTYTELLELTRHDLLTKLKGTCRVALEALSEQYGSDEALLESLAKDVEWQRYKHRLVAGVLWESSRLGHMVDYHRQKSKS